MFTRAVRNFFKITVKKGGYFSDKIYGLMKLYEGVYKNVNYDMRTNGEFNLLRLISTENMCVFFDIGANNGDWTNCIVKLFLADYDVYMFEIIPEVRDRLRKRFEGKKELHLIESGLSNQNGYVSINYYPEKNTHSTMIDTSIGRENGVQLNVKVERGDDFAKKNGIKVIDFLKIDVEGAEHMVLEGFGDLITEGAIKIIQFEYTEINLDSRFLLKDFYNFLTKYGYLVGKLYPNGVDFKDYSIRDEDFKGPNYVAVHNTYRNIIEKISI
jgi:FkbM family methyltransferase